MKKTTLAIVLGLLVSGCSDDKPTLQVFNWSDYISDELIQEFEEKNNCKVEITSFDSNEAMYAKLKAGASGYDVIFPSSYQVEMMVREDMLEKIDHSLLPNVKSNFANEYSSQILDKDMSYSIPYVVTYTGFLCLKDKAMTNSWSILGDKRLLGKVTLLDDLREVIGAGLMYNGFSLNSESQEEIDKAVETVITWKKNVRKFDAESYRTEVPNKSTWVGHGYSSDSAQAMLEDGKIRDDLVFMLPKEGFTIAFDEIVIMKNSQQKDLAYKFIDFLFETKNAVKNMEYVCGIMPQKMAIEKLSDNYKKIFIQDEEVMKSGQLLKSFVDKPEVQEMYNKAWDKVKAIER